MNISMSPDARYVTQSSVWTQCFTGPLTNAKIKRYILAGRYGEDAKRQLEEKQRISKAKLVRRSTAKQRHAELLKLLLS